VIYSSDFSRARETATIVQRVVGAPEIHLSEKLRERHFGDFEKSDHANYQKVWEFDEQSADHNESNVESINSVLDRAASLVFELEAEYKGKDILLVAHGDT